MDQIKVGKFIAELRKQRGLTQAQLGEILGVTNKTVSRWENGNYMPELTLIPDLADQLKISVNELMAGERFIEEDYKRNADEQLLKNMQLIEEIREIKDSRWLSQGIGEVGMFILAEICLSFILYIMGVRIPANLLYGFEYYILGMLPLIILFGGVLILIVLKRPRPWLNVASIIGVSLFPLVFECASSDFETSLSITFILMLIGLCFVTIGILGNRIYFQAIDKLLDANMKIRE